MSRKQQKKEHIDRHGQRHAPKPKDPAKSKHKNRVFLRDGINICLTALVIVAVFGIMTGMQLAGWFDSALGGVASVLVAAFGVTCLFDMAMLLTDSVSIADGMINAGKNEQGELMIFHTANIVRVELRDKTGHAVPEDRKRYTKVALTFVMNSGRINQRKPGRLTQKQLDEVRAAVRQSRGAGNHTEK